MRNNVYKSREREGGRVGGRDRESERGWGRGVERARVVVRAGFSIRIAVCVDSLNTLS